MARLDSIIRLKKWDLDEKRRVLVALEEARDAIDQQIRQIEQDIVAERNALSLEVGPISLGKFIEGAKMRRDALEHERSQKEEEIKEKHEEVAEAFRELKTFEIADQQEKARAQAAEDKIEQAALDEQGAQAFLRNDD